MPASLAAVLNDRLGSVSAETAQILRTAALLGAKFTVTELAVLLRRPVSELAAGLQEAVAARILVGSDAELAFRHQLIHQALYASMPAALRTALHAEAARELAATNADALSVAQQLFRGESTGRGLGPGLAHTGCARADHAGAAAGGRPATPGTGRDAQWRCGLGRAHGQPGPVPARGRIL
jgi:hypothetical protein